MTPFQYEVLVARHFEQIGYQVELAGRTGDLGLDVLAIRGNERVAIQAKMYGGTRRVNSEAILLLEGTRQYFDCTRAVIATDSELTPAATPVARKLNIEVLKITAFSSINVAFPALKSDLPNEDEFTRIWTNFIVPLEGQILKTLGQERENVIKRVNLGGITRISSNGKEQNIPIEIFRWAVRHLLEFGELSKAEINDEFKGRASAAIVMILAQVPQFKVSTNPMTLRHNKS